MCVCVCVLGRLCEILVCNNDGGGGGGGCGDNSDGGGDGSDGAWNGEVIDVFYGGGGGDGDGECGIVVVMAVD